MVYLTKTIFNKRSIIGCLPAVLVLVVGVIYSGTAISGERPDFKIFEGKWIRSDGGYVIHVRSTSSDGSVNVEYFNPAQINVSESKVSEWKGLLKLFIKLQGKGYPGSSYTLYYYAEKDALAGYYYQAEMEKTFEVIFLRKNDNA